MVRQRRTHVEVSMFPFLSVLCTVIGVLVLFIVLILSTRVVIEEEKYQATESHKRKIKAGRENVIPGGVDPQFLAAMENQLTRLDQALAERERQRDRLQRQLAGLENLLEIKKTELFIPLTRRPRPLNEPEPVAMVPSAGYPVPKKPIFVEVSSAGYTIHPSKKSFPPIEEKAEDGSEYVASPDLKEFLVDIDQRSKKEYLLFLIHPNGSKSFSAMRRYLALNHGAISKGWEPFSRNWIMARQSQR